MKRSVNYCMNPHTLVRWWVLDPNQFRLQNKKCSSIYKGPLQYFQLIPVFLLNSVDSYKDNYCREGIRIANAWPKVIIFCKSHPSNCTCKKNTWVLEDLYPVHLVGHFYWKHMNRNYFYCGHVGQVLIYCYANFEDPHCIIWLLKLV